MMAGLYRVWLCGAGNRWFSGSLYVVCGRLPEEWWIIANENKDAAALPYRLACPQLTA
ncbi:hypothetical protein [Eikenella corrodens]|uniref:hypothetical protein n=1 Tax=Eikenella corrodens TaxID=539 RepID=UPI000B0E9128|nr:hypothetical protein [Eikenella corrodens]